MASRSYRVIILGNEIQILTDGDITYEEGKRFTEALAGKLGRDLSAYNVSFKLTSEVEQHKPDGLSHAHVHTHESY